MLTWQKKTTRYGLETGIQNVQSLFIVTKNTKLQWLQI